MAKRFTDTEKWKKGFVRGLPGAYKLLWFYLCDECNHAGIWDVDFQIAQIKIGLDMPISEEKAIQLFQTKIIVFDSGAKWFIPSFIDFQYKNLRGTDKATKSVVDLLKKYNLISDELEIVIPDQGATKPLTSPCLGVLDKDKDKDMVKDKEKKEGLREKKEKQEIEFPDDSFRAVWNDWTSHRRSEYRDSFKTVKAEQTAFDKLFRLSEGDSKKAYSIVIQSIENHWKGLFPLKQNGSNSNTTGSLWQHNDGQPPKLGTSAARIEALKRW